MKSGFVPTGTGSYLSQALTPLSPRRTIAEAFPAGERPAERRAGSSITVAAITTIQQGTHRTEADKHKLYNVNLNWQ